MVLYFSLLYFTAMNITTFYTTKETAALLKTTTRGIDNLVYNGRISFVKRGGKRLFREEDIQAYIAQDIEIPAFGRRERND